MPKLEAHPPFFIRKYSTAERSRKFGIGFMRLKRAYKLRIISNSSCSLKL